MRCRSSAPATPCSKETLASWFSSYCSLIAIVAGRFPTSMRKRVELPVGLDLPPAMREPVGLEHQKADDDHADRDLAQEGKVVVQPERMIEGAAFQLVAEPLHRLRHQHDESSSHQRAHDRSGAAYDDHRQKQHRALYAEALLRDHELIVRIERAGDAG